MVVKVGSAGHVIDSVIQYNKGENRQESKNEAKSEKTESKKQISHSGGLSKSTDRVITASELAHEANTRVSGAAKNNAPAAALNQNSTPFQDAAVMETADGEVIENRTGLELSEEAVKITVDEVNKRISPQGAQVEFSYHEKTGRYSFRVMDKATGEVLREVPPQKSLDMVAKMFEMVGLIVDEKL